MADVEMHTEMPEVIEVIEGLKELRSHFRAMAGIASSRQSRANHIGSARTIENAIALLEEQVPRVMNVTEVSACEVGTILWVEERQGVTWNLFPLEIETNSIHPDTGTAYLFFITYHGLKKFECDEYNQVWRCWTSRPTEEQREVTKWN